MMRDDRGLGLIEALVAMTLLTIALSVFGVAFSAMVRTSEVSRDIGSVTDEARLALNELDRQVRFGYWVKNRTVSGASSAITVLTPGASGARECWIWAIDAANGRLLSFHFPAANPRPVLPVAGFGTPGSGWHIAAGPGGERFRDVVIGPASSLSAATSVSALEIATYQRVTYFLRAAVALTVSKGDRPPVTLAFDVSVRNRLAGAAFTGECP